MTDENIARLVDRDDYYLRSMYAQWTTDPSDPEVQAERERRERLGIKPPPEPVLRPVAKRPAIADFELWKQYAESQKEYGSPPEKKTGDGRKKISISELRRQRNS